MAMTSLSRKAACATLAITLLLALALFGCVAYKLQVGAHPTQPTGTGDQASSHGIDWAWLRSQNPDIVGWLTIPESNVNTPILRAPADDEGYYLDHDFYRQPNFTGCPYIDPDAKLDARPCSNTVITGHNMGWNREVFGDVASYIDPNWGYAHESAILSTPDCNYMLRIAFARTIPGWIPSKRTQFASNADFEAWIDGECESATTRYATPPRASSIITLATCSYNQTPEDERTLAYFIVERTEHTKE